MQYLPPPFDGYRVAGNYIISPDGQRITRTRMEGIMWRDHMELIRDGYASRRKAEEAKRRFRGQQVKVVIVDLADWHDKRFGRAGLKRVSGPGMWVAGAAYSLARSLSGFCRHRR